MIKVGVVGLGAMGQHHARLYSQSNCKLVGVADVDPQRAREIGEKYQIPYYSDYRELLTKVDAVSIAVPTTSHYQVAMDFLEQGIHCLVEKPIAFKLDEAQSMISTAKQNNARLGVGHIERFNPAVLKMKQILDDGALGQLLILSTRRVGPFAPRIQDVGVIIDSATHDIGVVKHLIGKNPVSVYSRVGSLNHPKEDHAIIVLDFESATACIEVNWFTPHKVRTLVATGSEGIGYLDYIDQKVTLDNSHKVEVADIQKVEPLKLELDDFLNSVVEGREPSVDGREGLEILKIALEAANNNYNTSQLVLHRK
jgi:UDP-N-acetylglucosamine 3-dehydrogenase